MRLPGLVATVIALAQCGAAADHPSAQFANELIEMQMDLPDPENGHYEPATGRVSPKERLRLGES